MQSFLVGNRYFFGIGINKYAHESISNLNNAQKDVEVFWKTIKESYRLPGLTETTWYDESATKTNIIDSLHTICNDASRLDEIIIYFSGHGVMKGNLNTAYWVPHDGNPHSISSLISYGEIMAQIEQSKAKHILMISDSCYSGALHKSVGELVDISTNTENPPPHFFNSVRKLHGYQSRWLLTSGAKELVSDGHPDHHSPFAGSLIAYMENQENKFFSYQNLAHYVTQSVAATQSFQTPISQHMTLAAHKLGQMAFIRKDFEVPEGFGDSVDQGVLAIKSLDGEEISPEDFKHASKELMLEWFETALKHLAEKEKESQDQTERKILQADSDRIRQQVEQLMQPKTSMKLTPVQIEQWKTAIRMNKVEKTLDEIIETIDENHDKRNTLFVQSSRFYGIKDDKEAGVFSNWNDSPLYNRLVRDIISVLDSIKKDLPGPNESISGGV
ncbi:caspase family protein [Pontibacter sp. G13]|uniref:caspase family protein n=1 Tax=Pontibacter sp. G13 TaxID=3074898 RepID=UPI0028895BEE|nr:caspase family protein [Pontibacter sp. G13]WNJ20897.1 caspase family protein [Pontibacter sp. G13]